VWLKYGVKKNIQNKYVALTVKNMSVLTQEAANFIDKDKKASS
jgi:hypothetical protein